MPPEPPVTVEFRGVRWWVVADGRPVRPFDDGIDAYGWACARWPDRDVNWMVALRRETSGPR